MVILELTQSALPSSPPHLHSLSNPPEVGNEILFHNPRMTDLVLSDLIKIHPKE